MRRILLFFPLCVLLLLSACGEDLTPSPYTEVNAVDGFWIEIAEGDYTPASATVTFHNETDLQYTFGDWFQIEVQSKDQWYMAEPLPDGGLEDGKTAHIMFGRGENQHTYNWEGYYGELPKGSYRIVTELSQEGETFYVTAEFTIE